MSAACCAFNSDWLFIAVSVDFPPRQKDDLEAATLQCQRLSAASLWIQEGVSSASVCCLICDSLKLTWSFWGSSIYRASESS